MSFTLLLVRDLQSCFFSNGRSLQADITKNSETKSTIRPRANSLKRDSVKGYQITDQDRIKRTKAELSSLHRQRNNG